MDNFKVIAYYDAEWNGSSYEGGLPRPLVFAKRGLNFGKFVDCIYEKMTIDRVKYDLRLFYLVNGNRKMPILDDGDVVFLTEYESSLAHIYVEKVDKIPVRVERSRVEGNRIERDRNQRNGFGRNNLPWCNVERPLDESCTVELNKIEMNAVVGKIRQENIMLERDPDFQDEDFMEVNQGLLCTGFDNEAGCNGIEAMDVDGVEVDDADVNVADADVNVDDVDGNGGEDCEEEDGDHHSDWEDLPDDVSPFVSDRTVMRLRWDIPGMDMYCIEPHQETALPIPNSIRRLSPPSYFKSKLEAKMALWRYAVYNRYSVRIHRSNNKRLEMVCVDWKKGCPFQFYCRRSSAQISMWHVTNFVSSCSCLVDPDKAGRRNVNARVIAELFASRLSESKFSPSTVMSEIRARFGVRLLYSKAWKALQYAKRISYGSPEESWQQLPVYFHLLKMCNPGTITAIHTDEKDNFMYSFLALGQSIEGFKKYIRPVISIDATHVKGVNNGVIFVACAKDGADMIYPIAFGFAPKEAESHWTWFLRRLNEAIGCPEELVIVSDRGKAIPKAVRRVFPMVPHVICYFHLKRNLKGFFSRRKDVECMFHTAAYTYSRDLCDQMLADISIASPNLYVELKKESFKVWTRAYCPRRRYNTMTTNNAESINKVILPARRMPITSAHEFFRGLLQRWFTACNTAANKLQTSTTSAATDHMLDKEELISSCQVIPIRDGVRYQVTNPEYGDGIVNVEESSCTCKKWDFDRLPCFHALAYARFARVDPSFLCHPYYSTEYLQGAYSEGINPIPHFENYEFPTEVLEKRILPMVAVKQAGRPREKRIPSKGENPRPKKCGNCGQFGHSQLTCPHPAASAMDSTTSKPPSGHDETNQPMCSPNPSSSTGRRVMHCKRCKAAGHNSRTCKEAIPQPVASNVPVDSSSQVQGNRVCNEASVANNSM